MPVFSLDGDLAGQNVTLSTDGSTAAPINIPDWGNVPSTGLPALTNAQWTPTNVPSLDGNQVAINITDVPTHPGKRIEAFKCQFGTGPLITLPYGDRIDIERIVRAPGNTTSQVRMYIAWRDETDRVSDDDGDPSDYQSVTTTTGQPTVDIEVFYYNAVAPAVVNFKAIPRGFRFRRATDMVFNGTKDTHCKWNFDQPGAVFPRVSNNDAIAIHGNDANKEYGRLVAALYQTPGSYTPSVTVNDKDGTQVVAQVAAPVVVQDPLVYFGTGNNNLFVDTRVISEGGGVFTVPQVVRDDITAAGFDGENALVYHKYSSARFYGNGRFKSRVKYWYRNGQTHDMSNQQTTQQEGRHMSGYGSGAPAIMDRYVSYDGTGSGSVKAEHCITGINFQPSPEYDVRNPQPGIFPERALQISGDYTTIVDCVFDYCSIGVRISAGSGAAIVGCEFDLWQDMAIFGDETYRTVLLANTAKQDPQTMRRAQFGGSNYRNVPYPDNNTMYASHATYRNNSQEEDMIRSLNDFGSHAQWASLVTLQATLREAAKGISKRDVQISRNRFDGALLNISATAGAAGSDFMNAHLWGNIMTVAEADACCYLTNGGMLVENNVFMVSANHRGGFDHVFFVSEDYKADEVAVDGFTQPFSQQRPNKSLNKDIPINFRNNSVVILMTDPTVDLVGTSRGGTYEIANTHFFAAGTPLGSDGPVRQTNDFTSNYGGYKSFDNGGVLDTSFASTDLTFLPVHLTGNAAIGDATGENIALGEFFGEFRGDIIAPLGRAAPSRGAFETILES